ncbi:LysM peptidoglycan-binding domain-containing protein [Roseovarius spongiae]|nr:LysM peptidoglycan-binding domain-containing protein [Roseovarius spongiae]
MTYRNTTAISVLTAGLALSAGAADAQTRCGASYEMQPGDTLYQVSQACRVSLARIFDLNPDIGDIDDIAVGTEIRVASRPDGVDDSEAPARDTYEVESGDTLFSIAQAVGTSVAALLNENDNVNPFALAVGEILDIPTGDRQAGFRVRPLAGPPGGEVTVQARNLTPGDYVTVGVGPTAAEWRALRQVRVAADGELRTDVGVPDWADPGDILTYVIDTDRGVTLKSRDFDVVARDDVDDDQSIALEGRVRHGVECYTLTTPDGDLWSLTGEEFTAGEYVEIEGARADMSICQQGIGTVDVDTITEVQPQ